MPKEKINRSALRLRWIKELKLENQFTIDGPNFLCQPCVKSYPFPLLSQLRQHVETTSHNTALLKFRAKPEVQLLLRDSVDRSNPFYTDLCKALLSAKVPFQKLENPEFHSFLEKYTKRNIPSVSTLRKDYLPKVYAQAIEKVRDDIGNHAVRFSVDETTDACGRYIANVLVGKLDSEEPSTGHLLASKHLERTNHVTIIKLLQDSFQLLWPLAKQEDISSKFLLLLTDGVPYMLKAGKKLKQIYPSLLHVTCVVHGLHLVAEGIRSCFPLVDKFIASVKAVFLKAPSRVSKFQEMYPDLNLPPQPIITRWGTWISAAKYYAENYNEVKSVLNEFDSTDAMSIQKAKEAAEDPKLAQDLAFLYANYAFLSGFIERFQEPNFSIANSIEMLREVETKLAAVNGTIGKQILNRFKAISTKNPNLGTIKKIDKILRGENEVLEVQIPPAKLAAFKYAPLTTVDAESSFSIHKELLSPRRRNMTVDTMEMSLICQCEL